MRKNILSLPLIITVLFIYCCKKDTGPATTAVTSAGSFSASVDGVTFTSDTFSIDATTGQYLGTYATRVGGSTPQLSVIGQKNNPDDTAHTSISFFTATVATGRYSSTTPGAGFCDIKYAHGAVGYEMLWHTDAIDSGTVNITKLDTINKLVSGTFSFTAYSATALPATHVVTQGVFTDVAIKP